MHRSDACAAELTAPTQTAPQQQPQPKLTIGFVEIDGDPRYEPIQGSDRIVLKARAHPFTGAEVGIDEAAALTRVLRTDFALERITVKSAEEVAPATIRSGESSAVPHSRWEVRLHCGA